MATRHIDASLVTVADLKAALPVSAEKLINSSGVAQLRPGGLLTAFRGTEAAAAWDVQRLPEQTAQPDEDSTAPTISRKRRRAPKLPKMTMTLVYPFMPDNAPLTRGEADRMTGYTIHECGHALFSENSVMTAAQAHGQLAARLCNAIEDARIERDVIRSRMAGGARRCLEILAASIGLKHSADPAFDPNHINALPVVVAMLGREAVGLSVPGLDEIKRRIAPGVMKVLRPTLKALPKMRAGRDGTQDALDAAFALIGRIPQEKPQQQEHGKGNSDKGEGDKGENCKQPNQTGGDEGERDEQQPEQQQQPEQPQDAPAQDQQQQQGDDQPAADVPQPQPNPAPAEPKPESQDRDAEVPPLDHCEDAPQPEQPEEDQHDDSQGEKPDTFNEEPDSAHVPDEPEQGNEPREQPADAMGAEQDDSADAQQQGGDDGEGQESAAAGAAGEGDEQDGEPEQLNSPTAADMGGDGFNLAAASEALRDADVRQDMRDIAEGANDERRTTKKADYWQNRYVPPRVSNITETKHYTADDYDNARRAIGSLGALKARLAQLVICPDESGLIDRQMSGRFDRRRFSALQSGADSVFMRRWEAEGYETAVALLVDLSVSMWGTGIKAARAVAIAFGEALEGLHIDFEVLGFQQTGAGDSKFGDEYGLDGHNAASQLGDDVADGLCHLRIFKPFARRIAERKAQLAYMVNVPNGLTPDYAAIRGVIERMLRLPHRRKVVFSITDGKGAGAEVIRQLVDEARPRAIDVIGVGIGHDVSTQYELSMRVDLRGAANPIHDMTAKSMGLLVKQFEIYKETRAVTIY